MVLKRTARAAVANKKGRHKMNTGMTEDERDRLTRAETQLQAVRKDVDDMHTDMRKALHELRNICQDLRLTLALQGRDNTMAITRPMDKVTGIKLALVGLGSFAVFVITVIGGLLGIAAYFRSPH